MFIIALQAFDWHLHLLVGSVYQGTEAVLLPFGLYARGSRHLYGSQPASKRHAGSRSPHLPLQWIA